MRKNRCLIKLFTALAMLMLAVNAAVLHFGFGIRFSDLAGFIARFAWDGPAKMGDSSSETLLQAGNGTAWPGDGLSEGWDGWSGDKACDKSGTRDDGRPGNGDSPAGERTAGRDSPVGGQPPERDGPSGTWDVLLPGDSPLTGAKALEVINNISIGDKIFLYRVLAKIGASELDRIVDMARDGITAEEMDQIKAYAGSILKPADAARLEEMFEKYGHIYAEAGN